MLEYTVIIAHITTMKSLTRETDTSDKAFFHYYKLIQGFSLGFLFHLSVFLFKTENFYLVISVDTNGY